MQFITDVVVGILTAYLAFSNFLAAGLINLVNPTDNAETTIETTTSSALSLLPSTYDSLPTFLKDSWAYQQAAVIGSTDEPAIPTASDPIDALVNIYCTFITPSVMRTTTGTGFFVNSNGVILTNAHVAQFLLLENTDVLGDAECLIRSGNPAIPQYRAELLYIPPAWVQEHAAMIDDATPTGTGERDYALLYVTSATEGTVLPTTFPNLSAATDLLPRTIKGSSVVAAGYPAESLLEGNTTNLIPKKADTSVTELYTFGSNYADVVSIQGSIIGEHGSSGGPIVNSDGQVIGIITTRGNDETDGVGSLRAITLSHIHRTMVEETGNSFARHISGDVAYRADVFTSTMAPFLTGLLTQEFRAPSL